MMTMVKKSQLDGISETEVDALLLHAAILMVAKYRQLKLSAQVCISQCGRAIQLLR